MLLDSPGASDDLACCIENALRDTVRFPKERNVDGVIGYQFTRCPNIGRRALDVTGTAQDEGQEKADDGRDHDKQGNRE